MLLANSNAHIISMSQEDRLVKIELMKALFDEMLILDENFAILRQENTSKTIIEAASGNLPVILGRWDACDNGNEIKTMINGEKITIGQTFTLVLDHVHAQKNTTSYQALLGRLIQAVASEAMTQCEPGVIVQLCGTLKEASKQKEPRLYGDYVDRIIPQCLMLKDHVYGIFLGNSSPEDLIEAFPSHWIKSLWTQEKLATLKAFFGDDFAALLQKDLAGGNLIDKEANVIKMFHAAVLNPTLIGWLDVAYEEMITFNKDAKGYEKLNISDFLGAIWGD